MKVWAATRDTDILDLLSTAVRMRWPTSGQIVVPGALNEEQPFDTRNCDLAIVDTALDEIDAGDVIKAIRRCSDVPLLVLSNSKGDQIITARALANGANDYIFKPLEVIDLIFHMEAAIGVSPVAQS